MKTVARVISVLMIFCTAIAMLGVYGSYEPLERTFLFGACMWGLGWCSRGTGRTK